MSASRVGRSVIFQRQQLSLHQFDSITLCCSNKATFTARRVLPGSRAFHASRCCREQSQEHRHESFGSRLGRALRKTKVEWKFIPVGLGIGFLGLVQARRIHTRQREESDGAQSQDRDNSARPPRRKRVRPSGPWQVQVMSTLPLKALSRLWGRFNELTIPYYLRVPGFRLYSWIFGVNLSEVSEPDLHTYPNLAAFFYRTLKSGARPIDPNPSAVVSPADGRVLQFGTIENGEVEQIKGMTYSLDALLGTTPPGISENPNAPSNIFHTSDSLPRSKAPAAGEDPIEADQEFANVNGISYTLPNLFSGGQKASRNAKPATSIDASTTAKASSVAEVRADFALAERPWYYSWSTKSKAPTSLYYMVVYLAPGDYHRFHSPVSWVAERRRHFAGELFSVSPYLQRTLPGLFTLNERVVLLGRWRWGFFSYTPVGATNVGSIKVNFDAELRTNSLTTDTAADRAAAEASEHGEPYSGYSEATYGEASKVLGGHALRRGEEMGGFQLGSSIVLVFEAPRGTRRSLDEGWDGGQRKGGWHWNIEKGQRVRVGESIGWVEEVD